MCEHVPTEKAKKRESGEISMATMVHTHKGKTKMREWGDKAQQRGISNAPTVCSIHRTSPPLSSPSKADPVRDDYDNV